MTVGARDIAELAKLTTALRIAGAAGFERGGVVVHSFGKYKSADNGRPERLQPQARQHGHERAAHSLQLLS